ncbi:hypothetical protein JTB14_029766 [Gonioctena quinquepunctata]|nr:hypothetical protein JTB14_029766 [Gonioctena quinquepunctata]
MYLRNSKSNRHEDASHQESVITGVRRESIAGSSGASNRNSDQQTVNNKIELRFSFPVMQVDCQSCRANNRITFLKTAKAAEAHAKTEHPKLTLSWVCRSCGESFPGWKNISVQKFYCRRRVQQDPGTAKGQFPCRACEL